MSIDGGQRVRQVLNIRSNSKGTDRTKLKRTCSCAIAAKVRKENKPHLCCPRAPRTEFHKSNEAVRLKSKHRVAVSRGEQLA